MERLPEAYQKIVRGISAVLSDVDLSAVEEMVNKLIDARDKNKKVLVVGAGRSGLVGKAFAMRLMHLGFNVYVLGETITPSFGEKDLIIVISGSGSTNIPVTVADVANKLRSQVIAVTSYPDSPLGKIADLVVKITGREQVALENEYLTRQLLGKHESFAPMGTLFEDSCLIFLDAIISELMARLEITESELESKHATVE